MLTFKVKKTSLPEYLNCHLVPRASSRSTRSVTLPLFTIPASKTEFARRSLSYVAQNTWNRLPDNVITCDKSTSLKKRLKIYLFKQYFMQRVPKSASRAIALVALYNYEYYYYYLPLWTLGREHVCRKQNINTTKNWRLLAGRRTWDCAKMYPDT